ncbi:MAG: hypothetical protein FJW34_16385 [Acidobacteria bacterium]|nr:hypothetical protein [Acidobacteriota bacterium]
MIASLLLAFFLSQAPIAVAPHLTLEQRTAAVRERSKSANTAEIIALIEEAAKEPDARFRREVIERLSRIDRPEVRAMLERHAQSDPDAEVALIALENLRQMQAADWGRIFDQRLGLARLRNDTKSLAVLTAEHQRWTSLAKGAVLPSFLAAPPKVFQVSAKPEVRVVAFGDFGLRGSAQTAVAKAVAAHHRNRPFDFGITLGDNIVPVGVDSPDDVRWRAGWEEIYDPLGIEIYAATGNHDWMLPDSPAAEILYSRKSATWRMPALYYTYTAGPVQFFALATEAMSETQVRWLDEEISRSTARWKVVYGHHPIYTHRPNTGQPHLERMLLPVLKGRVHAYVAGHDHMMQHLKPVDGVHLITVPASGQAARSFPRGERTLAADSFYGFLVFDIDARRMLLEFVDRDGETRYRTQICHSAEDSVSCEGR